MENFKEITEHLDGLIESRNYYEIKLLLKDIEPADLSLILQEFPHKIGTLFRLLPKDLAAECGFAANVKEYKKNKEAFKGHIGDVAEMIRIVMTCRKQTPNLYDILCVLGSEEVNRRLDIVINKIK